MKKVISLILVLSTLFTLCIPAGAFLNSENFRLLVPENWEMKPGDGRSIETVFKSSVVDRNLKWSVEPAGVASVDRLGRVTALRDGTAVVTASDANGNSVSVTLTVKSEPTKLEKSSAAINKFKGTAISENKVLQKLVTRYPADNCAAVPEEVKNKESYPLHRDAVTADGAHWEIKEYGVLRTDKNAANKRDREQRFMGDRYFYSNDSENVRAIFSDGSTGIWTAMDGGYSHISMVEMSGAEKAVLMSDNSQKYVSRRGMMSDSYIYGDTWIPHESDNDGLWTAMYGAGELMRYAVVKNDPDSTPAEIEAARKTAVKSTEAVLLLSNISMRTGTTEGYVRAQRNGNVTQLNLGKYYTDEALLSGGDISQAIPYESPADAFSEMNGIYKVSGIRTYIMSKNYLSLMTAADWVNPAVNPGLSYEKRTRTLEGFWARTYHLRSESSSVWGNIYWSVNGDGTATGVSSIPPDDDEYLLNGENLRGVTVDASGKIPERLWNDLIGAEHDVSEIVYKGDTSTDEVIGHLFIYKIAYDILGDEDPELKQIITDTVEKFAQHLSDNNYCLTEAAGQPTTWGKFNRNYMHNGQNVGGAPLQAAILLSTFKLAAYMTGNKKWEDEYRMAALDPAYEYAEVMTQFWERYKTAILEYAANGVSPALSFFLRFFMETKIMKSVFRMVLNYSDEEMSMLAFYLLFQMEDDEKLLKYYRKSLEQWWYSISFSENPMWYYVYQLAYPDKVKKDKYGNNILETAAWSLSRHPVDTVKYCASNPNRDDIKDIDLKRDCDIGGTRIVSYDASRSRILFADNDNNIVKLIGIVLSSGSLKWAVAAPDERALHKFNTPTYILASDYNPREMEASTTYTLPYWFGRYHGMLK